MLDSIRTKDGYISLISLETLKGVLQKHLKRLTYMSMEIRPFSRKVRPLSKLTHEPGFKHMAINVLSNTEHFT